MADRHTLDDAAAAALWRLRREPLEHIGLLYEQDGSIRATPTASRNRPDKTRGHFSIPAGSLRGIYHNHPSTGARKFDLDRFSKDDITQAKRLGVPSYITTPAGALFRYDPATGTAAPVLAMIPIDEIAAYFRAQLTKRLEALGGVP